MSILYRAFCFGLFPFDYRNKRLTEPGNQELFYLPIFYLLSRFTYLWNLTSQFLGTKKSRTWSLWAQLILLAPVRCQLYRKHKLTSEEVSVNEWLTNCQRNRSSLRKMPFKKRVWLDNFGWRILEKIEDQALIMHNKQNTIVLQKPKDTKFMVQHQNTFCEYLKEKNVCTACIQNHKNGSKHQKNENLGANNLQTAKIPQEHQNMFVGKRFQRKELGR